MQTIKLNLGSGLKRFDGYLNVDTDDLCKPDYNFNITEDVWPFPDNSVTDVICHHIMEHLPNPGLFHFIKELHRVCVDGAIIDIEVPHHRHDIFFGDPTHVRPYTIDTFRLFSKKYNQWHIDHHQSSTGFGMKCNVDFEVIEYEHDFDPRFKTILASFTDDNARELYIASTWNVVQNLKVKWQVIKD